MKKKYDLEDECHCWNPACGTPEFGSPSTAQSVASSTPTTISPSASAIASSPTSASSAKLGGRGAALIEILSPGRTCVVPPRPPGDELPVGGASRSSRDTAGGFQSVAWAFRGIPDRFCSDTKNPINPENYSFTWGEPLLSQPTPLAAAPGPGRAPQLC